jgi:hypothetical protein
MSELIIDGNVSCMDVASLDPRRILWQRWRGAAIYLPPTALWACIWDLVLI